MAGSSNARELGQVDDHIRIERALLSVYDKSGLIDFARGLVDLEIQLISTGGTARELSKAGVDVTAVKDVTGYPEIFNGRVKTFHPKLQAGLLFDPLDREHQREMREHDIDAIGLACVNLYPFEATAAQPGASYWDVIEQIDVGGPTMIRAAAKNHRFSAPVVDPASYGPILDELNASGGCLSWRTRRELALAAFQHTARYDQAIEEWLESHIAVRLSAGV